MMHLIDHWVTHYGYGVITLAVALECAGLLVPGETVFFGSAIYASTTGRISILAVIAAAAAGAMIGSAIGYTLGRWLGEPLVARYGGRIGLTPRRLAVGRYLFRRHGGKMVFLGRFVSLLRSLTPILAGVNAMPVRLFAAWTVAGGIAWPALHGAFAYALGDAARRSSGRLQVLMGLVFVSGLVLLFRFLKRNERKMEEIANADEARHA